MIAKVNSCSSSFPASSLYIREYPIYKSTFARVSLFKYEYMLMYVLVCLYARNVPYFLITKAILCMYVRSITRKLVRYIPCVSNYQDGLITRFVDR